ncbi:MAG: amidohydrolase family protein, partial [Firmicutes bacterium]|nr:amidohydrolase family protein [Bacillota bacterium]
MYDLIIKNVRILDGTGAPWVRGAVAVQGGRIVRVGTFEGEAKKVVDGQDKYLAPGFIDIHCHSDGTLPVYPTAESRILQGVTTEIGGDCGLGVAPVSQDPEKKKQLIDYVGGGLSYDWTTIGEYLDDLEEKRPSVNFGTAVGHGAIRIYAMGFEARKPTSEEMEVMKAALRQALDDGAFCMSSGLIYPPGCYSDIDEMTELCKELVPYGAFYETHMRNEGDNVVESLEEAIEVCRRSGAPLQVCHHKIVNKKNWGKSQITIPMIQKAREEGLDVKCDQYPYEASATTMDSNIPQWAFEGGTDAMLKRLEDPETRAKLRDESNKSHEGRWGDIYLAYTECEANEKYVGMNILEIAEARGGIDPADACFDLVYDDKGRCYEVNYGMSEDDIEYIMKQPYVMPGSDGYSV